MNAESLEFALRSLKYPDWRRLETFASQFIASELSSYRNMAATYGDMGRDGEAYCLGARSTSLYQISTSEDWKAKISQTVARLRQNFKEIDELVYLTNREIGPSADDLKKTLRIDFNISLDVRDLSWFVDRQFTNPQRESASESLIEHVVGPLLAMNKITSDVAHAITDQEARIGLLHLALDASDKATDKGLTRSSFESLTLAALHDTDSGNRISAEEVTKRVQAMLPADVGHQVGVYVTGALARLSKKNGKVKHWTKTSDYCLSHDEILAIKAELSQFMLEEAQVEGKISEKLGIYIDQLKDDSKRAALAAKAVKAALEESLLHLGERFATQVANGEPHPVDSAEFKTILGKSRSKELRGIDLDRVVDAACAFIADADQATCKHLRRLGDAYTLFAFLRQTADVQKAIVNLFADGQVWLDTTVVLPLIAESLIAEGEPKRYTNILHAAFTAGLKFYVTDGVIEEVLSHINRAILCNRSTAAWRSNVPFLYSEYINSGRSASSFTDWIDEFRGNSRPADDVADYLLEEFQIGRRNLRDEMDRADPEVRAAVKEYWINVHNQRRNQGQLESAVDPIKILKLAEHDTECFVGILKVREEDRSNSRGYRQWWLCLDRAAVSIGPKIRESLLDWREKSPVMNPDFLTEYLRIGPTRSALSQDQRVSIPVLTEMAKHASISPDLIKVADEARAQNSNMSERRIQRMVRDRLDTRRSHDPRHRPRSLTDIQDELVE
ncbi:hypothetical protein ACFORO_34635 [Amycolatopsis halotolerans]|uniref:EF-hand domain-containing protein n=1 Tax=Amycolatopsis halotolerans TaxID=330083 RepID=A0ABV7QPY3_9PSEU